MAVVNDGERQEISDWLDKVLAYDADEEPPENCRIIVQAGANLSRANKKGAAVPIPPGQLSKEKLLSQIMSRLKIAKASGERRVWVTFWNPSVDDKHAADSIEVEGDPMAARDGGEDDPGGTMSGALATIGKGHLGELRWLNQRLQEVMAEASEWKAAAYAYQTQIEMWKEYGNIQGTTEAIRAAFENLGPTIEKVGPGMLQVYLADQRLKEAKAAGKGEEQGPRIVTPGGRARAACARLEEAVASTAADLAGLVAEGALSEPLKMEVGGRLGALLMEAQEALGRAMNPPPVTPPEPEPEP